MDCYTTYHADHVSAKPGLALNVLRSFLVYFAREIEYICGVCIIILGYCET